MTKKFEAEGSVLHPNIEDAVAEILALRELGADIPHIFRPTVKQQLLVHQVLLPRLAHKTANQLFQVHFVFVTHLVMVIGYRLLVIEAGL